MLGLNNKTQTNITTLYLLNVGNGNGMTGSDLFADILQPAGAVTNNQSKPKEQTHLNFNSDNIKLFYLSPYIN